MEENQIGQEFNQAKAVCREFNPEELMMLLRSNISRFWSWDARQFVLDKKNQWGNCTMFRMTVSGHHHKGYVYITLNFSDLFDVYLTNKKGVIKGKMTDLYFDQLTEVIDERIEKIAAYTK